MWCSQEAALAFPVLQTIIFLIELPVGAEPHAVSSFAWLCLEPLCWLRRRASSKKHSVFSSIG